MKQTCILIIGMHRSGTSALSGTLSLLDVYLGSDLMKPTAENPKGYFENRALYRINETLLAQLGSSWSDVFYTEDKLEKQVDIAPLKETIRSEFKFSQIFAIKDPRLAYLFPLYRQALDEMGINIKVVLPYRNPLEAANSLKKRNSFSLERGMLLWAYHFLLAEGYSRSYPRAFVGFDELVDDPEQVVHRISDRIGIDLRAKYGQAKDEIAQFLDPDLKHHNISMDNLSAKTPKVVKDILVLRSDFDSQAALVRLDELRKELFGYQALFYNDDVIATFAALHETRQALQVKESDLARTQKGLSESKAALQSKETELARVQKGLSESKAALQSKETELARTHKSLHETREVLQIKETELARVQKGLNESKSALQAKEAALKSARISLQKLSEEKEALGNELALLYSSRSWRYTRFIRKIIEKFQDR